MTFQDFLKQYPSCTGLDSKAMKKRFGQGNKRADFIIFGGEIVCEYKEVGSFDVKKRVEKLRKKGELPQEIFEREMYSSMNEALDDGEVQISDTKRVLELSDALGLIILENKISTILSVAALFQAADRKMVNGLPSVDAIFCLDLENQFIAPDGQPSAPTQLFRRRTERSVRVGVLWDQVMRDFCRATGRPFRDNFVVTESHVRWHTHNGSFVKHSAELVIDNNNPLK